MSGVWILTQWLWYRKNFRKFSDFWLSFDQIWSRSEEVMRQTNFHQKVSLFYLAICLLRSTRPNTWKSNQIQKIFNYLWEFLWYLLVLICWIFLMYDLGLGLWTEWLNVTPAPTSLRTLKGNLWHNQFQMYFGSISINSGPNWMLWVSKNR